jgi:DNA-binding winged helix-turn-helix (wHTH) protein/TolB-like protein/Flp pilus assembly protein TadD
MDLRLPSALQFGDAQFDSLSGILKVQGRDFRLRPQTSAVLAHLLAHAGEIVSKDDLQNAVWSDAVVTENSLSQCISEIRQALGASAASLLETVPRRGFVLHAKPSALTTTNYSLPAKTVSTVESASSAAGDASIYSGKPSLASRWKPWRVGALLVLVMGMLGAGWVLVRGNISGPQMTLAVLPLEVNGLNGDLTWFGDVVGEDLTYYLARIPGAQVISRVSTQAYPASGMDVRTIGKELGVRYLVGGSLRQEADQVVLNLHLADTQSGRQQWAERFTTSVAQLPRTEHWAAQRIAQALHLQLIGDFAQETAQYTARQLDAQTLALQAWAAWNRDTPKDAERAKALALQALALDERSVLALKTMSSWHLRARINQSMPAEEALAGAEDYARRALAIDPRHPLVHTVMGGALSLRGEYEQAARHLREEIDTNPSHPVAYYFLGLSYLMQGEPDRAAKVYEQLLTISPRDTRLSRYYRNLSMAYLHQGQMKPALHFARAATETPQVFPNAWAGLAAICALSKDAACVQTAMTKFLAIRPGFSIEKIEAEWPPASNMFTKQHAEFVRGLHLAGLPDQAPRP